MANRSTMEPDELTRQVIGCFFTTYNELGFGLPESMYSAALEILFREIGLEARREHGFDVMFRNTRIGTYRLDYLVENTLVLELKAGISSLPAPGPNSSPTSGLPKGGSGFCCSMGRRRSSSASCCE
jgi:GxxExxY protein